MRRAILDKTCSDMYGFFATWQYCGFNKKYITAHIAHCKYFIYLIMHILGIIFFIILTPFIIKGQSSFNYITNPSFEDIDSCYGNYSNLGDDVFNIIGCVGWSNPVYSSSDHFCGNPKTNPPYVGNPELYQNPKSGNCMAGFFVNDGIVLNYREYIQNKLLQPLTSGKIYEISFYISATNNECSSVELGIKFSPNKFYDSIKLWLTDLVPDAVNDYTQYIPDTLNWQKITMNYKANGTEQFMIIGNFEDSSKIKYTLPCDSTWWTDTWRGIGNYFYIDDVSVTEVPSDVFIPNVFSPNSDGVNDFFEIKAINIGTWNCRIYNRWGLLITTLNETSPKWDGENYSDGTYYYVFISEYINKTGFFSLFK